MGTTDQIEILNDLIKINEENIHLYQYKATGPYQNVNLLLADSVGLKTNNIFQLQEEVKRTGGRACGMLTGSIYSKWKSLHTKLAGSEPSELLRSIESIEKAVNEAYKTALESAVLNAAQRFTLRSQYNGLLNVLKNIQQLQTEVSIPMLSHNPLAGPGPQQSFEDTFVYAFPITTYFFRIRYF